MKLASTRLEVQTLLPKTRPAWRNQRVWKRSPAAPDRKKMEQSAAAISLGASLRPRRVPRGVHAAHGVEHEDPPERELRHRRPRRTEREQALDGRKPHVVGHPGEGLALVEGLALPVEEAGVVAGECRRLREFRAAGIPTSPPRVGAASRGSGGILTPPPPPPPPP